MLQSCLAILLLLLIPIHAQSDGDRAAAERLFAAAEQSAKKGEKEAVKEAINQYNESLAYWRKAGDAAGEAKTLYAIGAAYRALGGCQNALEYYSRALALWRSLGDRASEVKALNYVGVSNRCLGNYKEALKCFEEVQSISKEIGDKIFQISSLNNMALVYGNLGDNAKALDYMNQIVPMIREMGDQGREGIALSNIGKFYLELGDYREADENLSAALKLNRSAGDKSTEGSTMTALGLLYAHYGDYNKSLVDFDGALAIFRKLGNRYKEAEALSQMGWVNKQIGDLQQSIEYSSEALKIKREAGDKKGEAESLNAVADCYAQMGDHQKAIGILSQALNIMREIGYPFGEAATTFVMAKAYSRVGDYANAGEFFEKSLLLRRTLGDRRNEAAVLYESARLERDKGDLTKARSRIEEAVALIESLRGAVSEQDFKETFFASVQDYYELYIDILMRQHGKAPSNGHDAEALAVSETGRSRSLLELLKESQADIRQGVDPELLKREKNLLQIINAKSDRLIRSGIDKRNEEERAAIKKEIESLSEELHHVQADIRRRSPRYAALTQFQPISLKNIQALLDPDTLLLEYALGKERSTLWVVGATSLSAYSLPKRSEIEALARAAYELLSLRGGSRKQIGGKEARRANPDEEFKRIAAELSDAILGPALSRLSGKRLIIVSDGALQYIPFAVLPIPKNGNRTYIPLAAEHEIASAPSASTIILLRSEIKDRKPHAKTAAVFADPVFDANDSRVKRSLEKAAHKVSDKTVEKVASASRSEGELERSAKESGLFGEGNALPRLLGTGEEAEAIRSVVPPAEGRFALGFEANRKTLANTDLEEYRIVHFATHGLLNSSNPEFSGIVLSLVDEEGRPQNGFLRLPDIYNLKLPADLVVLSACRTALGKEIRGEGLVGLTRGFMYAGAPRVIASLWKVDDEATAELMRLFYKGVLKDGMRPAAALRSAQISMWKGKRRQSPFYWGAFVLQGEWK